MDDPVGSGSTPSQRKLRRRIPSVAKGVSGNLGDCRRDANLLLSIEVQRGGDGAHPVTAEHDILFSPEGH
jgi:hypothetical protein